MHGYVDPKLQINLRDYPYKNYHDSFDQNNRKSYYYTWVSMVPSHDA